MARAKGLLATTGGEGPGAEGTAEAAGKAVAENCAEEWKAVTTKFYEEGRNKEASEAYKEVENSFKKADLAKTALNVITEKLVPALKNYIASLKVLLAVLQDMELCLNSMDSTVDIVSQNKEAFDALIHNFEADSSKL